MMASRDFSLEMENDIKYPIILSAFNSNPEDTGLIAYIKNNFAKIFRYLIDINEIQTIQAIIISRKFHTKRNLDKYINYAMENGRIEIQQILTDYKSKI